MNAILPSCEVVEALALMLLVVAGPPEGMRCLYGSTHSHVWFESGGDDGGIRVEVDRKGLPGYSGGPAFRAFRKRRPELFLGGRPADAFRYAQEKGGLDFLAVTVHNHMTVPEEYAALWEAAEAVNREQAGRFSAIVGQEWSTISSGNHVSLLGARSLCQVTKGRFDLLYGEWLPSRPETALVILNHPTYLRRRGNRESWAFSGKLKHLEYGLDDYGGSHQALARAARPYARLIEVITGPSRGRLENFRRWRARPQGYYRALNRGLAVGPCAGSDNHYQNWGASSPARTGVWTRANRPELILGALYARRTFATEDRNLAVWLEAEATPMGSVLYSEKRKARVEVTLRDADEADASYQVRILVDGDGLGGEEAVVVAQKPSQGAGTAMFEIDLPGKDTYLLAHVVQREDEDSAWTAPVWVLRRGKGP